MNQLFRLLSCAYYQGEDQVTGKFRILTQLSWEREKRFLIKNSIRKLHIKNMTFITRSATKTKKKFQFTKPVELTNCKPEPNPFQFLSLSKWSLIVLPALVKHSQINVSNYRLMRWFATKHVQPVHWKSQIRSSCNERKKSTNFMFFEEKMFSLSFRPLNSILKEEKNRLKLSFS